MDSKTIVITGASDGVGAAAACHPQPSGGAGSAVGAA